MEYRYDSCISSCSSFDIGTFPVVANRFLNPMRLKRLFAHDESSTSTCPKFNSGRRLINVFTVATATAEIFVPEQLKIRALRIWVVKGWGGGEVPPFRGQNYLKVTKIFRNEIYPYKIS